MVVLFYTSEPPKDDGGAEITKYVVELSEGLSGMLLLFPEVLAFSLQVTMKISAYLAFPFLFSRPFVGACLLRAGEGARV